LTEKLSKEERYILYAMGKCYQSYNKFFTDKPLEVTISKFTFIDIMISSKSVNKKERAIYRNLESLEAKKLIRYDNKELSFTRKGLREFNKVDKNINNYIELINHIMDTKSISIHKKMQTKLRNE